MRDGRIQLFARHGAVVEYTVGRYCTVRVGQHVRQKDIVGLVGMTGLATGPHLHFEVREGQIPRDPMAYLSAGEKPPPFIICEICEICGSILLSAPTD